MALKSSTRDMKNSLERQCYKAKKKERKFEP